MQKLELFCLDFYKIYAKYDNICPEKYDICFFKNMKISQRTNHLEVLSALKFRKLKLWSIP